MEDAVEIGLRSAFSEVGFTSFGRVLFGLKLRVSIRTFTAGIRRIAYIHHP